MSIRYSPHRWTFVGQRADLALGPASRSAWSLASWFACAGCRHSQSGELGAPAGASMRHPPRPALRRPLHAVGYRVDGARAGRCPRPAALQPAPRLRRRHRAGERRTGVRAARCSGASRNSAGGHPRPSCAVACRARRPPAQVLVLRGAEELPADAIGRVMLMFVAWAPGEIPAYHPPPDAADEKVIELIEAMVRHARKAGKLDESQGSKKRRKRGAEAGVLKARVDPRSRDLFRSGGPGDRQKSSPPRGRAAGPRRRQRPRQDVGPQGGAPQGRKNGRLNFSLSPLDALDLGARSTYQPRSRGRQRPPEAAAHGKRPDEKVVPWRLDPS